MTRRGTPASVAWLPPRVGVALSKLLLIVCLLPASGCAGRYATREAAPADTPVQGALAHVAQPLSPGVDSARSLAGDAAHVYSLDLTSGQRIRLLIDKEDLHLQATLCAPGGECVEFPSRRYGRLDVPLSVDVSGAHRLEVRALEQDTAGRPYRLRVVEAQAALELHAQAVLAARATAEADRRRAIWEERALREAVVKYEEAGRLWHSAGEPINAAAALGSAGDVHYMLSEYPRALDFYEGARGLAESAADQRATAEALNNIAYVYIYLGENRKAQGYTDRVLAAGRGRQGAREASDLRAEAQAFNNLGEIYYSLTDLRRSVKLFEQALGVWAEAGGDRRGEALAHLNIGYSLSDLGELREAAEHYRRSLALWQSVNDQRGVALVQTALGGVHSFYGEKQTALDLHRQAVGLFRTLGNRQGEAAALNGIAHAFEDLNEHRAALDNYELSLRLYEQIGNRDFIALNNLYVGRLHHLLNDTDRALGYYRHSLELSRQVGDRAIEAHALKGVGMIYDARGEKLRALKQFEFVHKLYRRLGNPRGQAYALNNLGHVHASLGERSKALACFRRALPLIRAAGDRRGEALILLSNAQAEREGGDNAAALALIEHSIAIIEKQRSQVMSKELRTSYFASVHQHYEFYIDLLMTLHAEQPGEGFATAALLASERARARSLMESLAEERIERKGGDSALVRREQELQQLLEAKAEYQMRLLSGKHSQKQSGEVARELRALTLEYQEVRARIREQSPRYAMLTQPELLSIESILREVRDGDTLLLEFSLGAKRSHLWLVSADGIESHELPDRATIENAARKTYELLTARQSLYKLPSAQREEAARAADAEYWRESATLSRMLLGPVAGRLGEHRLLIVSDGFLQYISFEALPRPSNANEPLVLSNEIVGLPSAFILSALRHEKARPAPQTIAVLADPVFHRDDPRIVSPRAGDAAPKQNSDVYLSRALRSLDGGADLFNLPRLPSTRREARAIEALLPTGDAMIATDFSASRSRVFSDELKAFRIVHFATHGILNRDNSDLSGLILSLVDEGGNPQNGFLRLHDIYNLELPAELVVLSACRTGLGNNVPGEGLVGLTRGFMYAGSKSVIASLWQVDDEATSELMVHFYRALLKDGSTPAAALRAAKREMLKREDHRAPYFWAAFVLQGEYRGSFVAEARSAPRPASLLIPITAALLLLSTVGLYALRRTRRSRGIV